MNEKEYIFRIFNLVFWYNSLSLTNLYYRDKKYDYDCDKLFWKIFIVRNRLIRGKK
jgi:hypothetical protein